MVTTIPPSLTDRFTWLIDGLCKVIGAEAHKRRMEAALAWAIWNRVRMLGDRLIALAERVRAGRLTRTRTPDPGPQGGRGKRAGEACAAGPQLPTEFGWIARMLPLTAQFAGMLAYMLRDPEVVHRSSCSAEVTLANVPHLTCRHRGRRGMMPAAAVPIAGGESGSAPPVAAPFPAAPAASGVSAAAHPHPDPPPQGGREKNAAGLVRLPPPQPSPSRGEGEEYGRRLRPPSWLEDDALAMRERVARWVARQVDPPSTLLPLGMSPTLALPGTGPIGADAKNRVEGRRGLACLIVIIIPSLCRGTKAFAGMTSEKSGNDGEGSFRRRGSPLSVRCSR